MKLNEIRSFVAVAEAQSVQDAADRLHLTQSAVSRLVQRLEGELGVILFDRQTKPLSLTSDGQLALGHARRVLKAADAMADAFARAGEPRGPLRLGSSHVLGGLVAGAPLDALRRGFPGLTVRLNTDWSESLVAQLAAGTIDGALTLLPAGSQAPPGVEGRRIAVEEVRVVAPPELAARTPRTLAALNATGWVLQPSGCGYRTALEHTLERCGLTPNIAVESYDQGMLLSLVARGVGFGMAPLRLLGVAGVAGNLIPIEVDGLRVTIAVWLLRSRQATRLEPVFEALESLLMAEFTPLHSAAE